MCLDSEAPTGLFRLINRAIDAHNVLVDNDSSIVGIMGFDGVMAGLSGAGKNGILSKWKMGDRKKNQQCT